MGFEPISCRLRDGGSSVELHQQKSERRGSNPLPPVWKTSALPLALRSRKKQRQKFDETFIFQDVVPSAFAAKIRVAGFEVSDLTGPGRALCANRNYTLKSYRGGTRTRADRFNRPALCQLSYPVKTFWWIGWDLNPQLPA